MAPSLALSLSIRRREKMISLGLYPAVPLEAAQPAR
jgi:hypothetical protein